MINFTLRQLEVFESVARHLSYTRAAQSLHLSQPAVSMQIRQLEGILPLCSYCRRIREGEQAWLPLESFLSSRSKTKFSHDICPDCWKHVVAPELRDLGPLSGVGGKAPEVPGRTP